MKFKSLLLLALAVGFYNSLEAETIATLQSPDGQNVVVVDRSESGVITYEMSRRGNILITKSSLGLVASNLDMTTGVSYKGQRTDIIDETYSLPTGKVKKYTNKCNQLTIDLEKDGMTFSIVFRSYNDGIAYRYQIYSNDSNDNMKIEYDNSQIIVPSVQKCWVQKYALDYSQPYPARSWAEIAALQDRKMCAPVLIKDEGGDDSWILITESENNSQFCTSALVSGTTEETGKFCFSLQDQPIVTLPFTSPWRTVYVGTLASMIESTLNENLNEPNKIGDTEWIHAGLSSWDWGGEDGTETFDFNVIKKYIDMAYNMNWPYFTLDAGWDTSTYRLKDVIDYATSKNVKVFIWSHQNRFNNDYEQIKSILSNWKQLGFAGIKVDFFENDSKNMMEKYEKILKVAADLKLMVNFHGCTKPSGLRRTYPNLITSEAVFGGEQYYFNHLATPANHNITLAMTRNVIGAMDYTPTEFARKDGVIRHTTTWSHQLALASIYESGIQTMSDSPDNIVYSICDPLLKVLPASWDEIKCLESIPDEYVTIVRRNGDDYYLSSISSDARILSVPLTFLQDGSYTAQIYKDGTCPSDIRYEEQTVDASTTLTIGIKSSGGVTVRLSKNPHHQPTYTVYESEDGTRSDGTTLETDNIGNCSGGKFIGFLGAGKTLSHNVRVENSGIYDMTMYYITQDTRKCYVQVNGGEKVYYTFSGNGFSWTSEGLAMKTIHIELQKGDNTITFGNDDGYCPNLDRITLSTSATGRDVHIGSITYADRSDYKSKETITASFTNNSITDISNLKVAYQLNENEKVTSFIPSIPAGNTVEYSFETMADLSEVRTNLLQIWVEADPENNIVGDMTSVSFCTLPPVTDKPVSLSSQGGTVHSFSSQVNDSESASKLIDGNDDTKWCDNQYANPWVILQLPQNYDLTRFVLRDCKTREKDKNLDAYALYVTNYDPSENKWTCVIDTKNRKTENIKIDNISPVSAKYVKLVTYRPDGDNAVRIYSFDVYGTLSTDISNHNEASRQFIIPSVLIRGEQLVINNCVPCCIKIYNTEGKLLRSLDIKGDTSVDLGLKRGLYVARVVYADMSCCSKFIIK